MSEDDIALSEKRVYADKRETTVAYAASDVGCCRLTVSGDQVGRISLPYTGPVRDVAGAEGRLLVATDEDVRVGTGDGTAPTGFGEAVAVGVGEGRTVSVAPDGRVAELRGDRWVDLASVDGPRRFDGPWLATEGGVVRVGADGPEPFGLDGVTDVAAAGLYAVADGDLHRFADGTWMTVRAGDADRVAADGSQVHLVEDGTLWTTTGDGWRQCDLPVDEPVADVAYGESAYAVTVDGTFLVDADPGSTPDGTGGWRHRALGVTGVSALAVP
jgi:hypothetical protein